VGNKSERGIGETHGAATLNGPYKSFTLACFNQKPISTMDRFVFIKHINWSAFYGFRKYSCRT